MHLQRIQVPDFRVLKNVDITFEKEFIPRIFPLGSLNGGGKSTLLQLIFVLLHCSTDQERIPFLQNFLQGFTIPEGCNERVLAIIDIWDYEQTIKTKFLTLKQSHILNFLELNEDEHNSYNLYSNLITLSEEEKDDLGGLDHIIKELEYAISDLTNSADDETKLQLVKKDLEKNYEMRKSIEEKLNHKARKILAYFKSKEYIYICKYSPNSNIKESEQEFLICHIEGMDIAQAEKKLKQASQKIFLASPSSQVFIFMSKKTIDNFFDSGFIKAMYYKQIEDDQSKLPGFFTYDFLAVDLIIESFKAAKDQDFIKLLETGDYGNNYKTLSKDLNSLLLNKRINVSTDFSGVTFKVDRDGEMIELSPADLSHGELKRLSIYMWLKYHNIENAIVLMDEIEIALHPDWQYQIVSDLQEWSPSNQYILATHSYELCQALTPAHVKELDPKLIKLKADS